MAAIPTVMKHAVRLYAMLEARSETVNEEQAKEYVVPVGSRLFVGNFTHIAIEDERGFGASTRQKAYTFLKDAGCVEVVHRGGRDYPSVILLVRPPDSEDSDIANDPSIHRGGRLGSLEVAMQSHIKRIAALEAEADALNGRFDVLVRDIELRLSQLAARVDGRA